MSSLVTKFAKTELARRAGAQDKVAAIEKFLFRQQLEFIRHPSRNKLARCGRRGGKSTAAIGYMLIEALSKPDSPILYLGLTRESAVNNIWKPMLAFIRNLDISHEAHTSRGAISFPNGSKIQLFGVDASGAVDRLRGNMYKLAIADEFGFSRDAAADNLIESLAPALADLDGTLCMMSSPGYVMDGLFYECDQGKKKDRWHRVHWTLRENPFFHGPAKDSKYSNRAEEILEEHCKDRFGGNRQHPGFRREYEGLWVSDDTNLVYPTNQNTILESAPRYPEQQHAIGIDLGSVSASAIVVLRYSHFSRHVCVVDTWKQSGLLVDELAKVLQQYIDKYRPTHIIADTGGLGKVPVEEFRRRYHMPIASADKMEKSFYSSVVANDLHSGYINVTVGCHELTSEWAKITKDTAGQEIKGQENHLADAFLYAYRKIFNTVLKSAEVPKTEEERFIERLSQSAIQEADDLAEERLNVY
jgi:hypothetical protein